MLTPNHKDQRSARFSGREQPTKLQVFESFSVSFVLSYAIFHVSFVTFSQSSSSFTLNTFLFIVSVKEILCSYYKKDYVRDSRLSGKPIWSQVNDISANNLSEWKSKKAQRINDSYWFGNKIRLV